MQHIVAHESVFGIQELNFDELDLVDGGMAPVVAIAAWRVGGFLAAVAIAAAIDYYN